MSIPGVADKKVWLALVMVLLILGVPIAAVASGIVPDPISSLKQRTLDPIPTPEGWQGGSLEDLLRDFQEMEGDDTLLRMLDHVGATPEDAATIPIDSHVLATSAPAKAMPALYEAKARSSDIPLQTALLEYNNGLDLMEEATLLVDPEFHKADNLPMDARVAIAVLLYAITDATMLQKKAVSGLSPEDYTSLLGIPGMIAKGGLDPTDRSEEADENFAQAYGLLSQVDRSLIDQGALIMVQAVSHALPTLRDWGERERAIADDPDDRVMDVAHLLDQYTPERIEQMDPIQRLDILADTLRMAADIQGFEEPGHLQPLPPPSGERPLRKAIEDLVGALSVAGLPINDQDLQRELIRADSLPDNMQEAVARVVVNQVGVVQATQVVNKVVDDLEGRVTNLDMDDLSKSGEISELSDQEKDALLTAAADLRHAEVRVVRAVQASAPVLEAWGLFWSHHGQQSLPATPAHAPGTLSAASEMGSQMGDPEAGLQEILRLSGQLKGADAASHEAPPLPPQGALVDTVLELYTHYGIPVDESVRDQVQQGVDELPEVVERNAARILLAQVDAMAELKELEGSMSREDHRALAQGPLVLERLLEGSTVTVSDVETLRSYYEVVDRTEGTYLDAASRLAAAVDASADALGEYSDAVLKESGSSSNGGSPKSGSLLSGFWSFLGGFELVQSASAQSGPGEPYHLPPVCPVASPLADCDNDVWFMDPLLESVVVAGFDSTEFDPRLIGTGRDRSGSDDNGPASAIDAGQPGQVLTVALGGDNVYRNNAGGASPTQVSIETDDVGFSNTALMVAVALDLNGNDRYLPAPPGFSFDAVQGASITGIGALYDRRGDDHFEASGMAQGFAAGGVGALFDGDGDDHYVAQDFAQGSSLGLGLGVLVDHVGNDRYSLAGGNETVPAVGQGGAMGLGGIGILVDGVGNDQYEGGMQGRGSDGGIGFLVDLEGEEDSYSRLPPAEADETWDWNDRCWTSLRAPRGDSFDGTVQEINETTGLSDDFDDANATAGRAMSLAGAVLGDTVQLMAGATAGTGVFVDRSEQVCRYDPSPLFPDDVDPDLDPDLDLDRLIDLIGDLTEPGDDHLLECCAESQDIQVFAVGDAGDSTYEGEDSYEVILDIGGNNTFLGRSSGATLLVNFDINGNDQYLASGENCVQACNAILLDLGGDDTFEAKIRAQGVSREVGMSGVLFNAGGDDIYIIEDMSNSQVAQGGVDGNEGLGIGILLDAAGNDTYHSPSQGVVHSDMIDLIITQGGGNVGLFLDLGGVDGYQPAGRQGFVEVNNNRGGCQSRVHTGPTRDGMAAFVNVGGHDTYRGTVGNPSNPGLSDYYNDRLSVDFNVGGCANTPEVLVRFAPSLFWDLRSDNPTTDLQNGTVDGSPSFRMAQLGIAVGTLADEVFEDDYTLLVSPGGNDTYHNNAGATWFRGMDSSSDGPNNPPTGNQPANKPGLGDILVGSATYTATENHPIAALLIDLDGNDQYELEDSFERDPGAAAPSADLKGILTQGAGFLGTGILVDDPGSLRNAVEDSGSSGPEAGADTYTARAMSQGFGLYGWGILWDRGGDDTFRYDPAVVKRPAIDGNLVAWLEYDGANEALEGLPPVPTNPTHDQVRGASTGTWVVKARGVGSDWEGECTVNVVEAGEDVPGPFHGAAVSRAENNRLAFSAFNQDDGVWRLLRVRDLGDSCSGRGIDIDRNPVAQGGGNPLSNQINPQFASLRTDDDMLWQDDRDGTWSLYYKDFKGGAAGDCSRHLGSRFCPEIEDDLLGGHDPATSNQTNPHGVGPRVVYQDDRHAEGVCPEGTWSIHRYNFNTGEEEQLSEDCGVHVNPRMSDQFVVWQTRQVDDAGEPAGTWDLSVYRLTGPEPTGGRERLVEAPGDQYGPVVVDETILYTNGSPDGEHSVNQYFWNRDDPASDENRVERFGAVQPALDAENRFRAVWVDTTGRSQSGGPVDSEYWEVHRQDLGTEAFPRDPGDRRSNTAATESQWLQGVSYANGRGIVFNEGGRNTYVGDRFAQGAAASLIGPKSDFRPDDGLLPGVSEGETDAWGVLMDADGNDAYSVRQEGQGVHFAREIVGVVQWTLPDPIPNVSIAQVETTASLGLLLDLRGNDRYEANRNSQGYGAWIPAAAAATMAPLPVPGGSPTPQPWAPPYAVYAVQSYGLFMDLGGLEQYAYGQKLYGENINVGWGTCSNLEDQVLQPLQMLAPNETIRQIVGPIADDVGLDFNETFNELTEEHFATLDGVVSEIVGPLMDVCGNLEHEVEQKRSALTNEPPRGSDRDEEDRNDQIWRQKPPRGGLEDTEPPCGDGDAGDRCPHPFVVGGIGMDLPLMDNLNMALQQTANHLIRTEIDVTAIDDEGVVQERDLRGGVIIEAEAEFQEEYGGLNLEFRKAEFFAGLPDVDFPRYLGDDIDKKRQDPKVTFIRPWHTDSEQTPDQNYTLQVRVHYKHANLGFTLGYANETKTFQVDNIPRILQQDDETPFISDSDPDRSGLLTAFSPAPITLDDGSIPGHPRVKFNISKDHPEPDHDDAARNQTPPHDGWVQVEIFDDSWGLVDRIVESRTVGYNDMVNETWHGTDEQGMAVPAGRYWINISATDRDPGDWSNTDRVRTKSFPVDVYSNTPRDGCVLDIRGQCSTGDRITRAGSEPGPSNENFRTITLELDVTTDSGTAPPGNLERLRRYHVDLGAPDGRGGIEWDNNPETLPSGSSEYNLKLVDGEIKHVMVIAEDWAGNLECLPECGGMTAPSQGDPEPLIRQAFENKRALIETDHSEESPLYTTFRADFTPPASRGIELFVDGEPPDARVPRVGPETGITITYVLEEDQGQPIPLVNWVPIENIDLRIEHTDEDPEIDVKLLPSEHELYEELNPNHDLYHVTWTGWPNLAKDWPQGLVTVSLGAQDITGNPTDSQRTMRFLLDTTKPEIRDTRVAYPDGKFHADEGDTVRISLDALDPDIGTFISPARDLRLGVDAQNVTVAGVQEDSPCLLRFEPSCFTPGGRWETDIPIDTTGMQIDWDNLTAKAFNVTITVTDVAGNTLKRPVEIVLGSPRLDAQLEEQSMGIYNADIAWSTARNTTAFILYGEGTTADDLVHRVNSTALNATTLHEFNLTDLDPGTQYVYRFFAVDPETGAQEAGSTEPLSFATLHGVGMQLQSPDPKAPEAELLSGVYRVEGHGWVQSARDDENLSVEPRVVMRLHGPGLPEGGRAVFDGETENEGFAMDLVTDALEDGFFTLETTVSYLGEQNKTTVEGLLVDNTPSGLRFVDPRDDDVLSESPKRVLVRVEEDLTRIDLESVRLRVNGNQTPVRASFIPDGDREDGIMELSRIPRLSPGIHRVEVFADDSAGNPGHARMDILVDPQAPEAGATAEYPVGQSAARPGQWVTLQVAEIEDLAGVEKITANTTIIGGAHDAAFGRDGLRHVHEVQLPGDLKEGEYPVPVWVRDAAGNVRSLTATVVVDTTPPSVDSVEISPLDPRNALVEVNASEAVTLFLEAMIEGHEPVRVVGDDLLSLHRLHLGGLQAGGSYDVEMRVIDRAGHEASDAITWKFQPRIGEAPAVANLTATPAPSHVRLDWDDGGDGFRYAVHRATDGSFETVGVTADATLTDREVTPGSTYRYFVQAVDPGDGLGAPSGVIDVEVPLPVGEGTDSMVSVHPQVGVADQTEFVFSARLQGMEDASPSVWLVLDGESWRMSKGADEDCREECTFRFATQLSVIDLRALTIDYHVEVFDAYGATRLPASGSMEGPRVIADDTAHTGLEETPALSVLILIMALLSVVLILRRRDPL